jgi:iron(III) transport system substrate-binding protein
VNKHRKFGYAAIAVLIALVTACSPAGGGGSTAAGPSADTDTLCKEDAGQVPADFQKPWSDLIAKAKTEGSLQIIAGTNVKAAEQPVWDCFGKAFGIDVVVTAGSSSDVTARVLAERTQGRHTVDVSMLGSSGTNTFLKAKAFAPLAPMLIHPDITDRSGWYLKDLPWFDGDTKQYVTLYVATLVPNLLNIYYNTDKVSKADLDSLQSLQNLLDPRWTGKIVMGNVAAGEAAREAAASWQVLGQGFFDKLLENQKPGVVPLGASRQYTDGILRGQWDMGILGEFSISDINQAIDSGLPIANLTRTLKEGPDASVEGQLGVFDPPAHPAAAQLFVNWLLSKQGQTAYNALLVVKERPGSQSFRNDVPQGAIPDEDWKRMHNPDFSLSYDPDAFAKARDEAQAYFKEKFAALKITP